MGRFRDRMDEEHPWVQRRYADCYLRRVRHFVRHFMASPDRLTPEHVCACGSSGGAACGVSV